MTGQSVSQLTPKPFRLAPAQFPTDRLIFFQMRRPINLARFVWRSRQKFCEYFSVSSDGDLLAVFDPFGESGKMISQVANRGCFHCDTKVSHAA